MLDVSRIVNVSVSLTQAPAAGRNFNTSMIAGDSNVINGLERYRTYSSITDVANDFGTTAPEYLAASLYFGQSPQPTTLLIGRWLRTASAGLNLGGILSPLQQSISNFNFISSGGFDINIDGQAKTLTGLDFTAQTNLNGVATVITAALSGSGTVTWNGEEFIVTSATTGAGVQASGTITFTTNPVNTETIDINGTSIEFVTSGATGNEVNLGGSAMATAGNLQAFLQASVDTNIEQATYSYSSGIITVTDKTIGTAGNSFTMTTTSSHITLSGATLTGGAAPSSVGYATAGSGTDISTLLKLTSTTSVALVPGYAAETPVAATAALASASTAWYGYMFAASVMPSDSDSLNVSAFIEALSITRLYGVTTQDANTLSALVTSDLASLMEAGAYEQSFIQYSSTNPYAVASVLGRIGGVDFTAQNSTITLMFKQEPGVVAENLTDAQADALEAKRCNVYALYDNATMLLQYGVCSGPSYIDETQGIDWFQNDVQTQIFNALYTSPTKIPQTDSGQNQLNNAAGNACDDAIFNGFAAPGTWNGPSFGSLTTGQYLKSGFYVFAQSIDLQSQSDREARKAPPIQIALKLAGAFQSSNVLVTINP